MKRDLNDFDYAEERWKAQQSSERYKSTGLDIVCELLTSSLSSKQAGREWVPASEWTKNFKPAKPRII